VTPTQARTAHDLDGLLDRAPWRPYHAWLIGLTALTIVFDGIDNQLLGVTIPTIMKEWAVPRAAFAPVVSLSYLGMMLGGAAAGWAGDRVGRRTALLASMGIFGVMTLGAALTHGVAALGWLRFAAGLGLGGAMPNAASLAAEYVPRDRRPLAVTSTIVCVPLGATLAGLLGIRWLPTTGWRALFMMGGVLPLLTGLVLWRLLPESPHYLARHRRLPELMSFLRRIGQDVGIEPTVTLANHRTSHPPAALLWSPDFRRDTLALWAAFFSCLLAVYLGFSWLPALLTGAGFAATVASTGIAAFNLGGVAGALSGALIIGRVGSRAAMLTMTAAAIAGAIILMNMALVPTASVARLMIFLTLTGGLINAVQTTMYALATHVYPSAARATGVGTAVAIGRLGAIASGYAGAWAIGAAGAVSFFGLMGAAMAVCFVALALVRRHILGDNRPH